MTRPAQWAHQRAARQALNFVLDRTTGAALFADMGTGKSRTALDVMADQGARRLVIVAPKTVCQDVWPDQLASWSDLDPVNAYDGPMSTRIRRVRRAGRGSAVIVNYEVVRKKEMATALLGWLPDGVIVDESHRIAGPGTKQSRAVRRIAQVAPTRLALSGTPISTSLGPLGIWSQFAALDPTVFEPTFTKFRKTYTAVVDRGDDYDGVTAGRAGALTYFRYRDLDKLRAHMRLISHRVKAEDVLDLPGEIDRNLTVRLGPKARRAYRQLEKQMVADVGRGIVTAPNALTKLLRLSQIASGYVPSDDGRDELYDRAKGRALDELLADLTDQRVVVMAQYRADLAQIRQVAKKRAYELSGRIKQLAEWRADPVGVLAVQIQAGSEGIDLTAARQMVWWSVGYDLVRYRQARARIHRPGQNLPVVHTHLIAADTVDQDVRAALDGRQSIVNRVVEALKAR